MNKLLCDSFLKFTSVVFMFMLRGNKLLWDYDPSQDEEIYKAYRAIRNAGVTIFDTADSYGEFFFGKMEV